jgi:4-amino-4-deoxy-L-arabinose transferase-like glycosyltransferase
MINPDESRGFADADAPAATPGFQQLAANSATRLTAAPRPTIVQRNRTTLTALAVVVGYLVLAKTTGIVLLGIFPVVLSVRAFQRKEQLAPVALLAAAVAVVFSLSVITHH